MVKLLVIGLDAGSWNVIEPLIREGKLPAFKRLMKNGVWGNLKSCIYYYTSPAWKCYSTGKNPGKLGAISFRSFDQASKRVSIVTSTSFKSREFWDILGEYCYKCGIVNMPLTFPPKKINGLIISGVPTPENGYTYPPELERKLRKYGYEIHPKFNIHTFPKSKSLLEFSDIVRNRFFVAEKLLNESNFDFFQLVIFQTDTVQHFFWKNVNIIEDFWKVVDFEIGKLLEKVNKDCYTFIISDHGATELKGLFALNVWLKHKGYLQFNRGKDPIKFLIRKIGSFLFEYRKFLPYPIVKMVNKAIQRLARKKGLTLREYALSKISELVDWQKTKAISIADDSIYITVKSDLEKTRNILMNDIRNIRDPKSNRRLVKDVKTKEEVFSGEFIDLLPHLIITPREGYKCSSSPIDGNIKDVWNSTSPLSSCHRLNGIFLAHGPGIRKGSRIESATVYDLAPTILHIFGIPIPQDIDGRVLKEIFEDENDLAKKPVLYERKKYKRKKKELLEEEGYYTPEEERKVIERLKELGYM